jgi:GDP-4-dehydro-6-deoxy-D-mannose reductase
LITGATGFLGREVSRFLERGPADVHTSSRTGSGSAQHHAADLTSCADVDLLLKTIKPEVVIHLAGGRIDHGAEFGPTHVEHLRRANVDTTKNLLEGLIRLGQTPYVIVAGSAAEYGEPPNGPIEEETPLRPVTAYGRVKAEQTTLARRLCGEGASPLTIVRPFNVVSPRLPKSTALGNIRTQLLEQVGGRRTLHCGRIDVVRDYIPIEFVVETLARLTEAPTEEPALNVCSGVGIGLADIVSELALALSVVVEIELVDELVAIAAPDKVVGDPRRLAAMGLRCVPTGTTISATLLGDSEAY